MGGFQLILDDGTPTPLHGDDFVDHALNGTNDVPRMSKEESLTAAKLTPLRKESLSSRPPGSFCSVYTVQPRASQSLNWR